MANDNVISNAGSGGATFRTFSDGANEWCAMVPAYLTGGSAGAWTLQQVDGTHGLPVAVLSLPLPSGAATAAKQPALGTAGTASADVVTVQGIANGTVIPVSDGGGSLTVDGTVGVSGSVAVTGTFFQATQPVSAASLPLPTGASTEATLSTLSGKVPALGQALAAASTPVVLTAAQVTTLTPPTTVTANIGTSGSLALDATLSTLSAKVTACNTGAVVVSSGTLTTVSAVTAITNALPAGSNLIGQVGAYAQTDAIYSGSTSVAPVRSFANFAASTTDGALVSLTSSKKTRVLAALLVAGGTATNVTFNSKGAGAGTAISALLAAGANGGACLPYNPLGWFETNSGEALTVTTGSGSTVGIHVVTAAV